MTITCRSVTALASVTLASTLFILTLSSGNALAGERYATRPPVVLSQDLTAPWVMQLGGQVGASAGGQAAGQLRPVIYQRPRMVAPRGLFGRAPALREGMPAIRQAGLAQRPRNATMIDPQFLPQIVAYPGREKAGTVVIDTNSRFLYLVLEGGKARRYGVGVGKPGFEWAGEHRITRKAEWPDWTPPSDMIRREAAKGHYLPARMDGGPANPLGARAMYLGSSLYRIHGTNAPWSIGSAVSSGCIRMRNEDVTDLYERVPVGTRVVVM